MRVAITYPADVPLSPANWSGIPEGLASGLFEHGVDVVPLGSALPHGLREAVTVMSRSTGLRGEAAARTAISRWATTRVLAERFARALPLDAVIAMGTEMYDIRKMVDARVPLVTFDDATMAQQAREPHSDVTLARLPARFLARATRSQHTAARAATVCCVTTGWAAESFRTDFGIPAERVAVVGMGHRPRRTAVAPTDRDWSVPRFLYVGADWHRKNGAAVLDAFSVVRQQIPGATLDLVGDHPGIDRPGVTTHGFLAREDPGAQRRLDRLYAKATCFVLPSLFDAAGIVYLEGASAGLPVVVTSRGGAPEMVPNGAVVVDPHKPEDLRAAMLSLSDPDTARVMGAKACRSVAGASWQHTAGRLLEALTARRVTRPYGPGQSRTDIG